MSCELTVVTCTQGLRPELLARCQGSVEAALPLGSNHVIITTQDWVKGRLHGLRLNRYVVFVDDDDTIHPNSLLACWSAMQQHECGLVVTDESLVDVRGNIIQNNRGIKTYRGIATHPATAHHMCMISTNAVDDLVERIQKFHGVGLDWAIKACAALTHGACHVPMLGYQWTQHPESMTRSVNRKYQQAIIPISKILQDRYPVSNQDIAISHF